MLTFLSNTEHHQVDCCLRIRVSVPPNCHCSKSRISLWLCHQRHYGHLPCTCSHTYPHTTPLITETITEAERLRNQAKIHVRSGARLRTDLSVHSRTKMLLAIFDPLCSIFSSSVTYLTLQT
jgi:hypothetical protein